MDGIEERETPVASTSASPQPDIASTVGVTLDSASLLNRKRTHIQQGDTVLLQLPSKNVKLVKLTPGTTIINIGKFGSFDVTTDLIGRPYGITYEIVAPSPSNDTNGATEHVPAEEEGHLEEQSLQNGVQTGDTEEVKHTSANRKQKNKQKPEPSVPLCTLRPFVDMSLEGIELTEATNEKIKASGARTLSYEEIQELKRQGVDGREIIARQIAEHEAFELKNEYSKAKYQKRKESKYLKFVTPLPPTIHNICQYWHDLEPRKIRELRPDTLAQMLTLANIRPGCRVLVVDDASGLLVASVAERLGGEGVLLQLHQFDSPPANVILPLFNLPPAYTNPNFCKALHWGWTDPQWEPADAPIEDDDETLVAIKHKASAEKPERLDKQQQRLRRRKIAQDQLFSTVENLRSGDFDAVVVSTVYEPMSVLRRILPSLSGSAQIVVHSPVLQPLSDMLQTLMQTESVLNPTIVEPWLRQYQVLPGRTHPEMNGTPHGGYILHATKVVDATEGESIALGKGDIRRNKRRRR